MLGATTSNKTEVEPSGPDQGNRLLNTREKLQHLNHLDLIETTVSPLAFLWRKVQNVPVSPIEYVHLVQSLTVSR